MKALDDWALRVRVDLTLDLTIGILVEAMPRRATLNELGECRLSQPVSAWLCVALSAAALTSGSQMPRHLISDAHEWINEIPTVPIYYLAKPQPRERTWEDQRGKKTLLSLTLVSFCRGAFLA